MKKKSSKQVSQKVSAKETTRIRHVYRLKHSFDEDPDWDSIPRGWIAPKGKFYKTNYHWRSITLLLGRGDSEDPETGEKNAHEAYSKGWISLGHGGAFNAIGHENVLENRNHPAVTQLRRLVSKLPHDFLRVEKQIGKFDPESGKHEDFSVKEYDLEFFIKHAKLKKRV